MSSRKEEKEQRRAERLARERQEQEQARRKRRYSIVGGGVLAVAATGAVVAAVAAGGGGEGGSTGVLTGASTYEGATNPPPQVQTGFRTAAKAAGCRLRNPVIEGSKHVNDNEKVTYKTNPPTSGEMIEMPAGDGVYDKPATASDWRAFVHTLEHSRILIQYDPALPQRRIDQLGGLYNEDPLEMVLLPNREMPYQVAATAWGHLIGCDRFTDETFDALRAFRNRYRGKGPEQG